MITEAHGGPWPTRDVLPSWMVGAASGGVLDFGVRAISIPDFSAPANGRRGWAGESGASLYIWGKFGGRIDGRKVGEGSLSEAHDNAAAHSRKLVSTCLCAPIGMGDSRMVA